MWWVPEAENAQGGHPRPLVRSSAVLNQ